MVYLDLTTKVHLNRSKPLPPLLAPPRTDFRLASENVLECFINDKKNTKGLTPSGEEWLRDTVGRFLRWLPVPLPQATSEHVVRFHGTRHDVRLQIGNAVPPRLATVFGKAILNKVQGHHGVKDALINGPTTQVYRPRANQLAFQIS